ncbi:hypothetical protein [Providencia heimbachae]|uniref:hypothetical protein n=1 Tax=Providencia heimbachae TaxID=333962 RepID=UPI001586119B
MTTPQLYAHECREAQRQYIAKAKADKLSPVSRKLAVEMALLNRKHARQWATIGCTGA